MLQPFEKLTPQYVQRLEAINMKIFVVQSYTRGINPFDPVIFPLLVSVYDDMGLAKTHFNAIKEDPNKRIININDPVERQELYAMVRDQQHYRIYWAVVRDAKALENKINLHYRGHMKRYLKNHTNWDVANHPQVRPSLQLVFGELYINLKHKNQLIRIKFEEIEKN